MFKWEISRTALWVAAGLALWAIIKIVEYSNILYTQRYLSQFRHVPELATYREAEQRVYGGRRKAPQAVLLLHGWSSGPADFAPLYPLLEEAGIPYLAPQITGFGLDNLRLLRAASAQDWLRDALHTYDILAAQAEQVDIVGHSNGGALAAYVAMHRPVRHLILIGPNLTVQPADRIYKQILHTPVLSAMFEQVLPVFRKPVRPGRVAPVDTVDPESARRAFAYPALPLRALRTLWDVQDQVHLRQVRCTDLHLFYGERDQSVDIPELQRNLDQQGIRYQAHGYANSAHNLLEDYDQQAAARDILKVLTAS